VPQDQKPRVIQDLYDRMDTLIGRVMQQIDDQTLLLVISDHGFKSFARCMNLNAWLHQNGYLVLKDGKSESGDWFEDVDWSRTRAYTMGLNGLYLNVKGREREGIVEAGAEAEALKEELRLTRRRGFSIDREEFRLGVICLGAAIRDHAGAVVGSISVSSPAFRATPDYIDQLKVHLIAAADELSAELGAPGAILRGPAKSMAAE